MPPDLGVDRGQVAVGERHAAGVAVEGLGQEGRGRTAAARELADGQDRVGRVPNGLRSAVPAPVGVRRVDGVYPGRPRAQRVRVVRGGGRDGVRGVRPAVIRLPYRHHVLVPGSHQGQPQGQVDRLGSRVDHEHGIERRGQQAGQPLGELHHRGVVEPGVGVQPAQLPGRRGLHPRVRVAEHGHVVHHVQVDPAAGGGQVVPPAPLDPRRVREVVLLHRRERRLTPAKQVIPGSRGDGRQSQQRPRIRDQRQPPRRVLRPDQRRHLGRALRRQAHVPPGPVPAHRQPGRQLHRGGRPQVDPGRDGRGGDLRQHPRPGQPRLAEPGGHGVVPLGQQGRSQPVLEPRRQPRPLVHRTGSDRQIQHRAASQVYHHAGRGP